MATIDPIWAAEFRGLFWGEGNFMIDLYERLIHGCLTFTTRCRCRIIARDDNRAMLEDICLKLGGNIYTHKSFRSEWRNGKTYTHHRNFVWQVQSRVEVAGVLDILEGGLIPSLKSRELPVMRKALALMSSRRHRFTDEQRQAMRDIQHELFALRQYEAPQE